MSANGYLTAAELELVDGVRLAHNTAAAWRAMDAAAPMALNIALPVGGYRSFYTQGDMKRRPSVYGISAAKAKLLAPAGSSPHGTGRAVDVGSFGAAFGTAGLRRRQWVLEHMHEYGFTRPLGEADPNHLVHNGTAPAGGGGSPITAKRKATMSTLYFTPKSPQDNKPRWALAGDGASGWLETTQASLATDWAAVHGSRVDLSLSQWNNLKAAYSRTPAITIPAIEIPAVKVVIDYKALAVALLDEEGRRLSNG